MKDQLRSNQGHTLTIFCLNPSMAVNLLDFQTRSSLAAISRSSSFLELPTPTAKMSTPALRIAAA